MSAVYFLRIPVSILHDPQMAKSLPTSSVRFPLQIGTYKLTPSLSTKFINLSKFVNDLDLDVFLTKPDSLAPKCNNSPFVDMHHIHIVTGDLGIIKNVLRKIFIKSYKLEGLDNCVSRCCSKNCIHKFFFLV